MYVPAELNPHLGELPKDSIVVHGYLVFSAQGHVIYTSETIFHEVEAGNVSKLKDNPYHCLTVANPERLHQKGIQFGNREVTLRGRFLPKYLEEDEIDLGACGNETGFVVE